MTSNNKTPSEFLNESSLSRLWRHNELHDAAAFTAFRNAPDCGSGERYTNKQNAQRNKSLLAKLKSKGYSVTTLHGTYPEGGQTKKEISYFVVDIEDDGNLLKDARSLGEEFDQDSILFIPKGSIKGEDKAYLIGTNKCDNNWLGYGKKEVFNKGKMGYDSEIYTSKVNGRPFIFENVGEEFHNNTGFGVWMMHLCAKKHWGDLEVNDFDIDGRLDGAKQNSG